MVFDHILDLFCAEHRNDDATCRSCQFANRLNRPASDLGHPRAAGGIDIKTGHRKTCINKTAGVDLAHQAETNDGNRSAHRETPIGLCMRIAPV